jgi:hypothetical protein
MRVMVFRMGEQFAAIPGPDGQSMGYHPDQLRTVALLDGEDETEAVTRYQRRDPTLVEYLGTCEAGTFPANDEFYNARRCASRVDADPQKNVGRQLVIGIDMDHARRIRYRRLIARRDDVLRGTIDRGKRVRLNNLDDAIAAAVEAAQTPEALKAITHPDLEG